MLVLTRKPNQQLHIGNDIVITIVKVRGNTIRLGIEAPKDVRVIRSELEPKPGPKSLTDTSAASGTQASSSTASSSTASSSAASSSAALPDDQPEAEAAVSDEVQQLVADACVTEAPVIFKARIKQPVASRSPLKRFTEVSRMQGILSERNVEDSPLCHGAPEDQALVLRSRGLHSYIASKNRCARPAQSAPRDPQAPSQDAASVLAHSQQLTKSKQTCNGHILTVQA